MVPAQSASPHLLHPSLGSSLHSSDHYLREMSKDDHDVLNVSPRPSHHINRCKPLATRFLEKTSNSWDTENEHSPDSSVSYGNTTSRSSAELVKEISMLEIEIAHLERYLLSLYRTAFQQHLPSMLGHTNEATPKTLSEQSSQKLMIDKFKDDNDSRNQSSPRSALIGPNDSGQVDIRKSSSEREKQGVFSRHRSLADHLGNSRIDDALTCPDRLSEEIIRCISSIYCKLANPNSKGCSVSSASSFCSSASFSPRNLSGSSWSPQCNDDFGENNDAEALKRGGGGPYAGMVEVLKICLDDETYNYAATMLQRFRSLVKSLEIVDPKKMKREEKLAFWINIHNALVMHAYLAYGTQHYIKSTYVVKAAYNVGGHSVNAHDIQSSILGIRSHYSSPWLQTLLSPGKKFKAGANRHPYSMDYPEPLVHFALSSGAYSDPAVRVYRASNVFEDLKVAKEEFVQATVYVHKETKIYLPKILSHYAKDTSMGMAQLLETVSGCLSGIRQKAIRTCIKCGNNRAEKYVYWLEQSSSFRYFIHKDAILETRSGA